MQPADDTTLLRQYAGEGSDEAFAMLVQRHIHLVYSVALRRVGDPHHAEEISQAVFIILARKAANLRRNQTLSSWLFEVTRLTANNFIRSEMRRHRREQEAHMQSVNNEPDDAWRRIAPLLDTAVAGLGEKDRRAILLRFYEGKNLRDIGSVLAVSEDAAEKRVARALEKLRKFLGKRGVAVSAAALTAGLSANSIHAAPIALAKTLTMVAVAKGAAATTSTLTLVKGALKLMAWTKAKTAIAGAVFIGMTTYSVLQHQAQVRLRDENTRLQQHQSPLNDRFQQLQRERDDARAHSDALLAENQRLKTLSDAGELLRLRAQVSQLKSARPQQENDPTESSAKAWVEKVNQLKQRMAQTPDAAIPELRFLSDQDWLNAAAGELNTDDDYRKAASLLRQQAETRCASDMLTALQAFCRTNRGQFPVSLSQLQPYFTEPVEDAILQRWTLEPGKKANDGLITQKAPVDETYDTRIRIGLNQWQTQPWSPTGSMTLPLRRPN